LPEAETHVTSEIRTERYGSAQVQVCFDENQSLYAPAGPSCPATN